MLKVKWSDLTQHLKDTLGNGCGPAKRFIFHIPQFNFKASCRQHDFYYMRGGDIRDKLEADFKFLIAMLKDTFDYSIINGTSVFFDIGRIYTSYADSTMWAKLGFRIKLIGWEIFLKRILLSLLRLVAAFIYYLVVSTLGFFVWRYREGYNDLETIIAIDNENKK